MRVVTELLLYTFGLVAALVLAALSGFSILTTIGASVVAGLLLYPVLLIGIFVGFHRSFDFAVELYDQRRSLFLDSAEAQATDHGLVILSDASSNS